MVNLETSIAPPKPKNSLSLVYRNSDQSLPEKLFQPLNVAIVVSVVIHGVAGYGLPALPFFQRPPIPKEVRLVELTPQEQSRIRREAPPLPPSVSGVPLPGVPSQQGTAVNPGLYNFGLEAPSNNSANNSTNNSTNNFGGRNFSSGNNFGGSSYTTIPGNPTPDDRSAFNPGQSRQWTTGGFGGNGQFMVPGDSPPRTSNRPRETPQAPQPLRQSERFITADNFTTRGRSIFSRSFTPATPSPTPSNTPSPSPNSSPSPDSSPSPLAAITPFPSPSVAVTPSPSPSPSGSDGGSDGGGTGVAVNPTPTSSPSPSTGNNGGTDNPGNNGGNGDENNGDGGSASPNGVTPSPDSVTPNPLLAFNPSQTELSEDGLSIGFTDFLGEGNEVLLQQDRQVKLTLDVPYPSEACGQKLGGTTIVGMILNEEGVISKGPAILQSSGYEIFNQAAIEAAKAYNEFSPAKVYVITVPFAYSPEVCPGGSNE